MDDGRAALAAAFRAAHLCLELDESVLHVRPRPPGDVRGTFPTGLRRVHVVTAWNPQGRRSDPAVNARMQRQLQRELVADGAATRYAEGRSPDGSWVETSVALLNQPEGWVLELARRYGQAAIYRWTPTHRAVVWCDSTPDDVHGWEASVAVR